MIGAYAWRQATSIFLDAASALNTPHTMPFIFRAQRRNTMIFVLTGVCRRAERYARLFYKPKGQDLSVPAAQFFFTRRGTLTTENLRASVLDHPSTKMKR